MRQLLVWQVPLPPEERRGSSRLGGRFIVAEYKPLLEISWNAYDFASERAFNVRLTWRGRAQSSVSRRIAIERACPLAPLQTSRLGLNFDSQLRE